MGNVTNTGPHQLTDRTTSSRLRPSATAATANRSAGTSTCTLPLLEVASVLLLLSNSLVGLF